MELFDFLNNAHISWKAKGIFLFALACNDDIVRIKDIVAHSVNGCDSVRSGIKELVKAGYLTNIKSSKTGKDLPGHYVISYEV